MIRIATLLLLLSTTACATIMAGGPDRVPVSSNPPGAAVFVDNVQVGVTPTTVTLDRGRSQGNIRIEMPGYAPVVIQRGKQINGWFWANLCVGGLIGMVIDLVTGDVKRFDDTPIGVGLSPGGPMGPPPGPPMGPPPGPPPPM
jgi:hypothetical protein